MAREKVVVTTAQQLVNDIAAGKFKPVYYFFGPEDYRIIEAEKFIATQFLPGTQRSTNYRRLDGRKTGAADLINELAAFPMLGEKQVIAVSDIQHYKPTDLQKILKMFSPTDPNRVIVLEHTVGACAEEEFGFYHGRQASGGGGGISKALRGGDGNRDYQEAG